MSIFNSLGCSCSSLNRALTLVHSLL